MPSTKNCNTVIQIIEGTFKFDRFFITEYKMKHTLT